MAAAKSRVHCRLFSNEPLTDFSKPANRKAMQAALRKVAGELGREYPLWIGGRELRTGDKLSSLDPSKPSRVVGIFSRATAEVASAAVEEAARGFETWRHVPAAKRVELLFRAADKIRKRKFEFCAWLIYEV
ncbi:MAG TPA: aldehyde dehydrogenase family protein, partial [Methylomirabilota bacterium]|nr:aldehyde dehydrogenase family protein [Methylomirabilota bacterium]